MERDPKEIDVADVYQSERFMGRSLPEGRVGFDAEVTAHLRREILKRREDLGRLE